MKSLKKRDSNNQGNTAAIVDVSHEADFDAGIQVRRLRSKSSLFFSRKNEDAPPPIPLIQSPPDSPMSPTSPTSTYTVFEEDEDEVADPILQAPNATLNQKESSSFGLLKKRSSQFFRRAKSSERLSLSPSPVPSVPPIPTEPAKLKRIRPTITPLNLGRSSNAFKSTSQIRNQAISSPKPSQHFAIPPIPSNPATVPVTKPTGPPPPRPRRPSSLLDEETMAFMRESVTRMCLPHSNRVSASASASPSAHTSTATCSTPRSDVSSIEVRLGFPTGHGVPCPIDSLESPLAASFPLDPSKRLPVRDSAGSIKGYSRFSEFIRRTQHDSYTFDGLDVEDRDRGPVEQYCVDKEKDWILERQISKGPLGNPGRLFRDRWGGFHFVPDF